MPCKNLMEMVLKDTDIQERDLPLVIVGRIAPEGFGEIVTWEQKSKLLSNAAERIRMRDSHHAVVTASRFWSNAIHDAALRNPMILDRHRGIIRYFEEHFRGVYIPVIGISSLEAVIQNAEMRGDNNVTDVCGTNGFY